MKHLTIPRTDLDVSALCLGTGPYGDTVGDAQAEEQLDRFVSAGGNFLDTANVYGKWTASGRNESERLLGRWLRRLPPSVASGLVVATKGAHPLLSDYGKPRLDRASIAQDLDESLDALGLERIGLYWLHRDDPSQDAGDLVDLMESFVAEGRIRWYGCSNWRANRIESAQRRAEQTGAIGFVAVQNQWSLARANAAAFPDDTHVTMDGTLASSLERSGLAMVPYTAMAHGYFTKRLEAERGGRPLEPGLVAGFGNALDDRRAAALALLSAERGVPASQLALAWLMHRRIPTVPIVSFHRVTHLEDAIAAADLRLSTDELDRLDCGQTW